MQLSGFDQPVKRAQTEEGQRGFVNLDHPNRFAASRAPPHRVLETVDDHEPAGIDGGLRSSLQCHTAFSLFREFGVLR